MRIVFQPKGWDDLMWWRNQDQANMLKVLDLVQDCIRDPWRGIGKPEPLKYLKPYWSRRVGQHDRMVYGISGKDGVAGQADTNQILIVACRGHYA